MSDAPSAKPPIGAPLKAALARPRALAAAASKHLGGAASPSSAPSAGAGLGPLLSTVLGAPAVLKLQGQGLSAPVLRTENLLMRPPQRRDYVAWARVRRQSQAHLAPWEPRWASDHLGPLAFRRRVSWTRREVASGRAYPFLIFGRARRRADESPLLGGVTLEHVRRGAAQSASLGYWLGVGATGKGHMSEALQAVIAFAFNDLDLSRIEAACLPHNFRSRRLLERCGFHQEGLARSYLQIDGQWRDHILYERRRPDRILPSAP